MAKGVPFTFAWTGLTAPTAMAATSNKVMSLDYSHDVPVTVHKDGLGTTFALSADEPTHTISIRTVPVAVSGVAAPGGLASAKTMIFVPDVLSLVTLTAATAHRAEFEGTWIYEGGASISFSPDAVPEISMTLHRHGTNTAVDAAYNTSQAFS